MRLAQCALSVLLARQPWERAPGAGPRPPARLGRRWLRDLAELDRRHRAPSRPNQTREASGELPTVPGNKTGI